ncbi:O-antigen ligase family protein [Clostridium beijerinckii]|uniref:O-antigen ligase-related domain-containing protein n=1 Tax=Clostridium beijerinckii TaxID=1520 RepID=A0A1S8RV84_CLOBE|nr:O-antigen ligase family protein [Clostridium beijerinckii]NRY62050.1 hypothetical protein [Clostridium beijerinckii]OOM57082.1 hypothetical protein CLBCK_42370 [Clostridium beijerinckii]
MKILILLTTFFEYLFALFVILDCNTPYAVALDRNYYITEIVMILIIILLILNFIINHISKRLISNWLKIFFPYYLIMFTFLLVNVSDEKRVNFMARFLIALPILTLLFGIYQKSNDIYRILKRLTNVISVLSLISLFFWFFGSQLHYLSPTGQILSYWGYEFNYPSYYGLYFERQMDNFLWIHGYRNIGIFCEGPMFSLILVISLFTEIFLFQEDSTKKLLNIVNGKIYLNNVKGILRNRIKISILVITLVTTTSTTGMVLLVLLLLLKYAINSPKEKYKLILKWVSGLFIIVGGLIIMNNLLETKSNSNSWLIRMSDYNIGFKAWMNSPLFGNGYGDWTSLQSLMSENFRTNTGFSNAIFTVLSQGGIVLMLVYVISIIGYFRCFLKYKNKVVLVFEIIFLIEFVVTLFQYTFIMMILLAYGYTYMACNLEERNNEKMRNLV